jgi:hypothetical protein
MDGNLTETLGVSHPSRVELESVCIQLSNGSPKTMTKERESQIAECKELLIRLERWIAADKFVFVIKTEALRSSMFFARFSTLFTSGTFTTRMTSSGEAKTPLIYRTS